MKYALILLISGMVTSLAVNAAAGCQSTAAQHYSDGLELAQTGHYYEAIEVFNICIDLKPDNPEALNNCGALSVFTGQYQPALDYINSALALEPELPVAYNNRGVAYLYQGNYAKAIDDFSQALNLNPNYTDASNNRIQTQNLINTPGGANLTSICVSISEYHGKRDNQSILGLIIGEAIDTPVLLVHGFKTTDLNLGQMWDAMVESLAGRDIASDNESECIYYDSEAYSQELSIKRIAGNRFTLYISNYTRDISLGTSLDIRQYSRNLAEEIKAIIEYEGVDRVDIVAHSMGGLVARSYIEAEDFPDSPYPVTYGGDVRKLIMLGTPNGGTYFPVSFYGVLDWESARQMEVDSQFLTELNTGTTGRERGVTYYAIAGNAYRCGEEVSDPLAKAICVLSEEKDNDGIVPVDSVKLETQVNKEEIPPSRWYIIPLTHTELYHYAGAAVVKDILTANP